MKRRDLIRHLVSQRCELLREGGRHSWWRNAASNRRTSVPRHREIDEHLARKICRDLGVAEP
ncbi:type II toxin-antitoxin system HicA family toxin [Pirellulimonas nuda]|uniref:type II toxin-antitoxin system HicA family toxin n=1 Tax=Pirellulimonas nuda TaxID=2528009 RepID=UPI0011A7959A|nr:type II toxin-antitoxin system HicA family toxin [Pirellulimonas nuda]